MDKQKIKVPKMVKITPSQLVAIVDAANNLSAMLGAGEEDSDREWKDIVKGIDRFLKSNGFKRKYA